MNPELPAQSRTARTTGRYCAVIPALDAEGTIGAVVKGAKAQDLSVVVVDDGSRDRTAAIAAAAGALVISHIRNQGKGCALRTGFEHALRAHYDGVITLDADGQHDPLEIPQLIQAGELQHAGIAVGNRMANGASMPHIRRLTNRLMSAIVSAIARHPIPDSQSGFRFIRREVLADVPLRAKRFEIETELIVGASARRWKIISVPIHSRYDHHRSHIRPIRETFRFLGVIFRYAVKQP
jgi:glycosyltransferase involved in cell wall biosynthesis